MIGMNLASLNWHNISTDETSVVHSDLEELRACVRRAETLQAQQPLPEGALEAEVARMLTITRGQALRRAESADLADLAHDIALLHQPPVTRQTDAMLVAIAQIVVRNHADNALSRWRPFDLTLMTEALSVSRSREARRALMCLAQQIGEYDLTKTSHWSSRSLARIAMALGTSGLTGTRPVMRRLAESIKRRGDRAEEWSPELMGLFVSVFGRPRDEAEHALRSSVADQVMAMGENMSEEDGWTAQSLAMVIAGLAKGRGLTVRRALLCLAVQVSRRCWTLEAGWTLENLVLTAHGLSQIPDPDLVGIRALLEQEIAWRSRCGAESLSRETQLMLDQTFPASLARYA